jgi:hypothetical protein
LLRRAAALGHALDRDPDLHLVADGTIVRAESVSGRVYRFAVPAGARAVWLASRNTVPADIEPAARDIRRLGVAVERLVLSDDYQAAEARHDDAALRHGFHADEATHRWTDGRARLPEALLRPFAGGFTLEVHLVDSGLRYRRPPAPEAVAAAA